MKKLITICCLCLACCLLQAADAPARPKYWPLMIGKKLFMKIELALTTEEKRVGLMDRYSLPADGGMIFVSDTETPQVFWMKNTRIPLDIIFVNAKGIVVKIHHMGIELPMAPGEKEDLYDMKLHKYPSEAPAQFAIELSAGQTDIADIHEGDTIDLRIPELLKLLK